MPVMSDTTGFVACDQGFLHRISKHECPSLLPGTMTFPAIDGGNSQCTRDTDCVDKPHGYCTEYSTGLLGTFCRYGCVHDEECSVDEICECGDPVGRCVSTTCKTDADCQGGLLCASYAINSCGAIAYACQTIEDQCGGDSDCPNGVCGINGAARVCQGRLVCGTGRPFLVHGEERLAAAIRVEGWSMEALGAFAPRQAESERALLAEGWTRMALMEHASIAAFARFTLQLLCLGAPADLVEASNGALARMCFAIASALAGRPQSPGPLPIAGSLDETSLREVLVTTIREGCIGETVAAIEAAEAREHAADGTLREVLRKIADDETRHAVLAWRFVRWAIDQGGEELRKTAARTFAAVRAEALSSEPSSSLSESDRSLLDGGIVPEAMRRAIRARAVTQVILPCAEKLLRFSPPGPARDEQTNA
jgi:hypothetical protein